MLQQILKEMYIDPDVLEALNEDQKKTLFLKMRQEQVRRWQEREDKLEREGDVNKRTKPKKANGKSVSWLLGRDGDVAVIVIGEMDELSAKFICSGLEKKSPPSLQDNTLNQSILAKGTTVEPNRTEKEATPSVSTTLHSKETSTLPPLSVSVSEHSTPPVEEKTELKPVVKPEEKSVPHTSLCPRPFVRTDAVIVRPATVTVTPGSLPTSASGAPPSSPQTISPGQPSKAQAALENLKSQETRVCKDVPPSRVTVRSASEDPLSSGTGTASCAGRGRVIHLIKAFSSEGSKPQSPGQTPTRGTKPPLPTKPHHLRATATPSTR